MRKLLSVLALLLATPAFGQQVQTLSSQYPQGAVPVVVVTSGADTTSGSAAMPAVTGQTNYVCKVEFAALGATAATSVSPTVGSLIGSTTLGYAGGFTFASGATVGSNPLIINYNPCIPASGPGTAITATLPGAAGNTSASINIAGYRQ